MPARSTADLTLGNPVMAIGWPDGKPKANACGESKAGRSFEAPLPINYSDPSKTATGLLSLSRSGPLDFAPSFSSDPKANCVFLKNKERC